MINVKYLVAFGLVLALAGCVTISNDPAPLSFSATGDGPRGDEDWTLLPEYFALEAEDGRAEYMLHLGDICKGRDTLPESYSVRVADLFKTSPIPVIFVPGDNEWNDLKDPDAGWILWERYFMGFEKNFECTPNIQQQPVRSENVAWVDKGVLMVGLNLVGGTVHDAEEWRLRHRQSALWVNGLLAYHADDVRAAVVFAQARPGAKHEDFFTPFVASAAAFGKPVLYLHGDGHRWDHEEGWRAPNLLRVQVDQVTKAPPVLVTVTLDPDHPFVFDRRLPEEK